jgi:hypothetical protein
MHLVPRYEARDFRDRDARNARIEQYNPPRDTSFLDHLVSAANFLTTGLFIGVTLWNVLTIGGWISDYYAKRRMERAGYTAPWKRSHVRAWDGSDAE